MSGRRKKIFSDAYLIEAYGFRASAVPIEGGKFQGVLTVDLKPALDVTCEHRHVKEHCAIRCAEKFQRHQLKKSHAAECIKRNIPYPKITRSIHRLTPRKHLGIIK